MGVNTPRAAVVAEATVGFAMDWHMPKEVTFKTGWLSIMVAAGKELLIMRFVGNTLMGTGVIPKEQRKHPIEQTWLAI